MTDRLTTERRSLLMRNVKGRNTAPELALRSMLHRLGYRFRVHLKALPGTPDIVFTRRRVAIFVHGCFWHGHGCRIGQPSKSRVDYWGPKLAANRERDGRKEHQLVEAGWRVVTVWQCELKDTAALTRRLAGLLGAPNNILVNGAPISTRDLDRGLHR